MLKQHANSQPISFVNRKSKQIEEELVYGGGVIRWLYKNPIGQGLSTLLTKRFISQYYGSLQNSLKSSHKIPEFIKKFNIPMEQFEEGPFKSFNEFFIRKFKPGQRQFPAQNSEMGAFAEGRYTAFESVNDHFQFPVKGEYLSAAKLLANSKYEKVFHEGPLYVARLCPVDYHRFHFPDEGRVLEDYRVKGAFHSVNPMALGFKQDILCTNERHVTILETKNFGKLAYIEVGALCVGLIQQTWKEKEFKRGQEKGYFLFGASTVVLIGEKGKWKPSEDLLKNTLDGKETLVQLGDVIAFTI
jgi:phosphatidylserine decarboxylase